MLCKHPSVEAKAFKEMISVTKQTGKSESIDEFIIPLTNETMENMQYLHAVLTDSILQFPGIQKFVSLMMYCQMDILGRQYDNLLALCDGEDDAEICKPQRWLNDVGVFLPESPFKLPAFQAGPRICLGKEFEYRQMKIYAAVLLRFLPFELRDKSSPKYKIMYTLNTD